MTAHALQRIETAAGVVSYRACGAGAETLLFLHGLGSGSASWKAQLSHFGERHRVIAWEAPGYGESAPLPGETPRAEHYAAALEALRKALGIARFVLVGHSMGGLIAAVHAARHPHAVRGLVLSHPARGFGPIRHATPVQRFLSRVSELERLGREAFAEQFAPHLLAPDARPEAVAHVRAVMRELRPAGYRQAIGMLGEADIFPALAGLAMPVLVLWGTADGIAPEADMRAIVAALPAARYEVLPGVGHAPYVEAPAEYNARIAAFMAACPP